MMEAYNLSWIKDAFSQSYSFFVQGNVIGEFFDKPFTGSKKAFLFGARYIFETEGVFRKHINIINLETGSIIGKISFSLFLPQAVISLKETNYLWKPDGWFSYIKWSIYKNETNRILNIEKRKEGNIFVIDENIPLLLVCGLLIRNRYYRSNNV